VREVRKPIPLPQASHGGGGEVNVVLLGEPENGLGANAPFDVHVKFDFREGLAFRQREHAASITLWIGGMRPGPPESNLRA